MTGHLIHVGYPKTGSTLMQQWFDAHPQLAHRYGSIAGFRDVQAIARAGAARDDDAILYRVTSCEGLSTPLAHAGDLAIDYSRETDMAVSQMRVCSALASLFPNAVVLIVTRGFRSMILSSYSQFVRSGGDVDLAESLAGWQTEAGAELDFTNVTPWDYDHLIKIYTEAFGAGNVIVMPYELLRDDPDEFTRWVSRRLGIDHLPATSERVNESLSPAAMYWYPRLTRLVRRTRSRKVFELYIRAAFNKRLGLLIAVLQRLRRGTPVTAAAIPDDVVNAFRGKAESLRGNPLYAPYATEYLHG
jgi:hypothetical protein